MAPQPPTVGCSPCWRTSSGRTAQSRCPNPSESTERRRRSGRLSLRQCLADTQSATLFEIALGRVKRLLAGVKRLLEAFELDLASVERALSPLHRCFEIRGLRLARREALLGATQPGTTVVIFGRELPHLLL